MRIVRYGDDEAREAIAAMQSKLSISFGATSPAGRQKTLEVFGEALSPQECVRRIVEDVRREGDAAVFRYTKLFDGVELSAKSVRVSAEEVAAGAKKVSKDFICAAENAIRNVRRYQQHILIKDPPALAVGGRTLGVRYTPVERAGAYVPGFSATLPSSVIMNCVPAQVAGVRQVALATPPRATGEICPEILACCGLLGIDEIYRVGGVQAIVALGLGTESIPKCDLVAGPGRLETTLAKKDILGDAAIDMLAGPSEVLVIADDAARPDVVAADLLSQAEHAPGAAFLVTPSAKLAEEVNDELDRQLAQLERRDQTAAMIDEYSLCIVTADLVEAAEVSNAFAPEHLQINTSDDDAVLRKIRHAGAAFIGAWTPVAAGDYYAGPSHTLPTGGTARFFSGLCANDFLKRTSLVRYDEGSLREDSDDIVTLAESEGLTAHARSVRVRFEKDEQDH
jgi:histidinol dehydrogenase